jgi:hypothetical protein
MLSGRSAQRQLTTNSAFDRLVAFSTLVSTVFDCNGVAV